MQLLIEPNYQGKEKEDQNQKLSLLTKIEIDYATQINVMWSPVLLQRAVDLLSSEYPDITVKDIQEYLLLALVVEEVSTKIVQVVYTDNDPIKTQKVLEAVNTVYQIYNREQQEQRLVLSLSMSRSQQ